MHLHHIWDVNLWIIKESSFCFGTWQASPSPWLAMEPVVWVELSPCPPHPPSNLEAQTWSALHPPDDHSRYDHHMIKLLLPALPLKPSSVCWGRGSLLFHRRKQHQGSWRRQRPSFPPHGENWPENWVNTEDWAMRVRERGGEREKKKEMRKRKREGERESLRHHFKCSDLTDSKSKPPNSSLPLFCFYWFGAISCSMQDFSSPTRDQTCAPCIVSSGS